MTRLGAIALVLAVLGPSSTLASEPPLQAGDPSWSPDARRIAFDASRPGQTSDIYVVNVDGTGLLNLTAGDAGVNVLPSWGRHIEHIAYATDLSTSQSRTFDTRWCGQTEPRRVPSRDRPPSDPFIGLAATATSRSMAASKLESTRSGQGRIG